MHFFMQLRRKLSAAEERNVQLERMLPKDGTFDHMRKEIESLDKVGKC